MKKPVSLILCCGLAAVALYSAGNFKSVTVDEVDAQEQVNNYPKLTPSERIYTEPASGFADLSEQPAASRKWIVNEAEFRTNEEKISRLIAEFDQNLDDPDKREELSARLSRISQEYKQQVLAKVKSLK